MIEAQEARPPAGEPARSEPHEALQHQPWLAFAGAVVVGFLFSRIVRSPDPRRAGGRSAAPP